jgi:predicted nucleic acid-binding protein
MSHRLTPRQQGHKLMVDTSALVALFDSKDEHHDAAVVFRENFILRYHVILYTTNFIHSEAMSHLNHLSVNDLHRLDTIIRAPEAGDPLGMKLLWVDKAVIDKSTPIYFKYIDHHFSITDCTSFTLMHNYDITAAFAFDEDFKIYTYSQGNKKKGFWMLPGMMESYLSLSLPHITFR